MKKIALTTWWHHNNYGTALQVTSMYKVLKKMGYDVDVINYIPNGKRYPLKINKTANKDSAWSEKPRIIDNDREKHYEEYIKNNLTFTEKCIIDDDFFALNQEYDFFISGSDQIWSSVVFDSRYFLDFVSDNNKKISYASSMQCITESSFVNNQLKSLLNSFSFVSAREENSKNCISNYCKKDIELVLDPTLLLSYDEWKSVFKKENEIKEKYIICYFLGDNEYYLNSVKKIAKQTGYSVKVVPIFTKDTDYGELEHGVGPEEFFNLIDNAEMVLTDSFHGVCFSNLCEKPFYVFERFREDDEFSQNSRIYNLLKMTGLEDRLIKFNNVIEENCELNIDFKHAKAMIQKEKDKSLNYLDNCLNNKKLSNIEPLVSIIIPVYNVEKFIRRCLDSIVKQTHENLEIIIIDDGTQDQSGAICDMYAQTDKRFKIIHKENGGVAKARNIGLKHASGEFVIFVDSDDVISPDNVEYLVKLIKNTNTDVACSLNVYNENTLFQEKHDVFEIFTPAEALKGIYDSKIGVAVWNKIWNRDFINHNKIRFNEDLWFGEGMTFCVESFTKSKSIGICKRRLYYQEYNPMAATRKFNIENWRCGERALMIQKKIWENVIFDDNVIKAYNYHYWWSKCSALRKIYLGNFENQYKKEVQEYKHYIRKRIKYAYGICESYSQKKFYRNIYFNPRKALLSLSIEESNGKTLDKLPWEVNISNEILKNELNILNNELEKYNSIKYLFKKLVIKFIKRVLNKK